MTLSAKPHAKENQTNDIVFYRLYKIESRFVVTIST